MHLSLNFPTHKSFQLSIVFEKSLKNTFQFSWSVNASNTIRLIEDGDE